MENLDEKTFNFYFSEKQSIAFDTLSNDDVKDVLYGGSKGGGKSVFGCRWVYLHSIFLIDFFGLKNVPRYPLPIGFIGRKRGVDFEKTTLETWKKFIPSELYKINAQRKEIIIQQRVKIYYGGLDDEMNINKFNSAEFVFVFIDQAEEISRDDFALLKGTLRLSWNGITPKYKTLLTANPAPCFLREDYIEKAQKDNSTVFIQALPRDNPYLPPDYIDNLKSAFKHRPELISAYVDGSWDQLEGSDVLIKHQWILDAIDKKLRQNDNRRVTTCDVSRFGDDETVIYNLIDNKIVGEMIYGQKDTTITAANIVKMAEQNDSDLIAIDGDGLGGGVCDLVKTMTKRPLLEIRSGHVANEHAKYLNARAEMWFHAARLFAEGIVSIPRDQQLIGQLTSVKYDPNGAGGRLSLEPKKDTKKRIDQSPDRADAFIYGLWAVSKVNKKEYDFNRDDNNLILNNVSNYGWEHLIEPQFSYGWRG